MKEDEAREILRLNNLRATEPRIQVMKSLSSVTAPVTYTELMHLMGDVPWDPATIFRNLVKLSEAGICIELHQAGGMTRYAMLLPNDATTQHEHPHFVCKECGNMTCLHATVSVEVSNRWMKSVENATIQLSGICPDCSLHVSPRCDSDSGDYV